MNRRSFNEILKILSLAALLLSVAVIHAQLVVNVSPVKVVGQKTVIPLAMENSFTEKIESARAAVFLLDEKGNMLGQATKWVIGGGQDNLGLAAKATNAFYFVITSDQPFATTNLTAKVIFNRLILEGGKSVDPKKGVIMKE